MHETLHVLLFGRGKLHYAKSMCSNATELDIGQRVDYFDVPWDAIINVYDVQIKYEVTR